MLKQSERLDLSDNTTTDIPAHVNAYLKKNRKTIVGAEVYFENQERTFLVWTDEGETVVFYPLSLRTSLLRPFDSGISIARICPELQYLVVASKSLELAVYRLREPVSIEGNRSFRFLSHPSHIHTIGSKQLKCNVLEVEFIPTAEDGVIQFVTVDEFDEVSLQTCRKKLLGYRAQIDLLPLVFENVLMIKLATIKVASEQEPAVTATILAISSQEAVTLCLVKPYF